MKIKQVEELVGISSKNIRFYEEQGLLSPKRSENGYRDYHDTEIKRLKQIKFLRKLGVPISQIQDLFNHSLSLDTCLQIHLQELDRLQADLNHTMQITFQTLNKHATDLDHLSIDECLDAIEQSEKEGVRFMDFNKTDIHRKKTLGAILGAGMMIIIMGLIIWLTLWANHQEPLPVFLLIVILLFPCIIMICTTAVLIQRLREIKGGEEDDAAQY